MERHLHILILEDSMDDVELIEHHLKKGDFSYTSKVVENRDAYESALAEFKPDLVLSDHSLPMFDSMLALQMFHSYQKNYNTAAAFILVTGTVSEEFAVQIIKAGADDYILKDRFKRLPAAVENAIEKNRLKVQRRKEEEKKLHLFDILQRSLHEIYVINPKNFHFEYANKEALSNLQYSLEDLKKLTPFETMDSFSELRFRESIILAQKRSKGLLLERRAIRKNRSSYPVQIHLQVIGQGDKKKILANVLDITEEKELEQQKELGIFIQNSFNHTRDLQGSLEIVLEKLCETSSCVAAEIYSREFDLPSSKLLAFHNNMFDRESASGKLMTDKVYESGKVQEYISTSNWKKEEDREWMKAALVKSAVAIPIKVGADLIAVFVVFSKEDVFKEKTFTVFSKQVQYKLAENIKRKKSEEELQKIFKFSPDIFIVIGKDGRLRKFNPALHHILGFSYEEMEKSTVDDLIHPCDVRVLEEWRKTNLKDDDVAHYESRWQTRHGDYLWFSWSVTPYMKGELHFAVGRNITESKRQLEAIRDQNKRLAEIAWEQSHVVRAPLTRLLACVEYLEEHQEYQSDILSSVKSSAYEIDKVIKDIVYKTEKVELNEKG